MGYLGTFSESSSKYLSSSEIEEAPDIGDDCDDDADVDGVNELGENIDIIISIYLYVWFFMFITYVYVYYKERKERERERSENYYKKGGMVRKC